MLVISWSTRRSVDLEDLIRTYEFGNENNVVMATDGLLCQTTDKCRVVHILIFIDIFDAIKAGYIVHI